VLLGLDMHKMKVLRQRREEWSRWAYLLIILDDGVYYRTITVNSSMQQHSLTLLWRCWSLLRRRIRFGWRKRVMWDFYKNLKMNI